jgi:HSP20 family molecular chaperone IbpA
MSEEVQTKGKYAIRELKKSSFSRTISLPSWVQDDPDASMKDGILTLKWPLPKSEEPEKPVARKIAIRTD